jgi:hypothetical protein
MSGSRGLAGTAVADFAEVIHALGPDPRYGALSWDTFREFPHRRGDSIESTQWPQIPVGCSRSSTVKAKLLVPSGGSAQRSGGGDVGAVAGVLERDLSAGAESGAPQLEGHRRPLLRESGSLRGGLPSISNSNLLTSSGFRVGSH